jgi:3,4-dihydroxy 2-butanone 4-phosphate synthase/GTP cyclohydrolase II
MPPSSDADDGAGADGFVFGAASVDACVAALRNGSLVLLTEDGSEDTHGLLVAPPSLTTPEQLQFVLDHAVRLQAALPPASYRAVYRSLHKIILDNNNLAQPALSVSARSGGRSPRNAAHIAQTVRQLIDTDWTAEERGGSSGGGGGGKQAKGPSTLPPLVCPGAVSLECCREGGVLRRAGATEASVELAQLAGLPPLGLHARLQATSLSALRALAEQWGIPLSSTADLVAYARRKEVLVERTGPPARMPTKFGRFTAHTFRSRLDGTEHIALVKTGGEDADWGDEGVYGGKGAASAGAAERPFAGTDRPVLVRVHSECCTGDVFGSLRCDCGPQLEKALEQIERTGWGVLLYLRGQEGRGIGLGAKMHAYVLQERGVDTLDANLELGLPVDSREYGVGAQILTDLGISDMRLMSNNPKKFTGLAGYGLRIVERVPSITAPNPDNIRYLQTKLERMGHMLGESLQGEGEERTTAPGGDADVD